MGKVKEEIKEGDWVRVFGEGNEAFKVEWIRGELVGLENHTIEPLNKVSKPNPDKFEVIPHTIYYWSMKN